MIKIGTVLQALNTDRYLNKGHTYRVCEYNGLSFAIKHNNPDGNNLQFHIGELDLYFKIISDNLCPACLKGPKEPNEAWCKRCKAE